VTRDTIGPIALAAKLPVGFRLGVATAAIQVEGGAEERGVAGWDVFAAQAGRILDGSTPAVTADHFHRWREDVRLIREAGLDAYRFSISWPRVQPTGSGSLNAAGMDWYERLVDELLAAEIRPMATIHHWDTPSELDARGGWAARETAERLGELAGLLGERIGDRIAEWVTVNEPATVTLDGYALGLHSPGRAELFKAIPVARNLLLGHGLAAQALRAAGVAGRIGIVNVHTPVTPATDSRADRAMAKTFDLVHNRLFADPVHLGRTPSVRGLPLPLQLVLWPQLRWSSADLRVISQPLDFVGLNYYFPSRIAAGPDTGEWSPDGEAEAMKDVPFHFAAWPEAETTAFGWPVVPRGLADTMRELSDRYPDLPPVIVTEGGASFHDELRPDGSVDDERRVAYLASHLEVAAEVASGAIHGIDLEGYFVWSLLDNWEWAAGFTQRFGVVHVDFDTGERTPKASWRYLRDVQRARRG